MQSVLSQEEIDSLLAALSEGEWDDFDAPNGDWADLIKQIQELRRQHENYNRGWNAAINEVIRLLRGYPSEYYRD